MSKAANFSLCVWRGHQAGQGNTPVSLGTDSSKGLIRTVSDELGLVREPIPASVLAFPSSLRTARALPSFLPLLPHLAPSLCGRSALLLFFALGVLVQALLVLGLGESAALAAALPRTEAR
ncbi:hypothetical protein FB451DRAFT_1407668 [Mycena latifolia]|nr:hypothetical protein FB451DRAFT_1407668 [Mycena latifolia]